MREAHESGLLEGVTTALVSLGIQLFQVEVQTSQHRDAQVELAHRGRIRRYALEMKEAVRPSTIAALAGRLPTTTPTLVVCRQLSEGVQSALRDRGIACADTAGNISVDEDGLLLWVAGKRAPQHPAPARERFGDATWRVVFALLRHPDVARWTVRRLAAASGVSPAAAGVALQALDTRGWSLNLGREGHRIVDAAGLLDAWTHGFAQTLSPRLVLGRAAPVRQGARAWAEGTRSALDPALALLGSELAAEFGGAPIHAEEVSVWVDRWDATVMRHLRLVPSPRGDIVVRLRFAADMSDPRDPQLAHPLLLLGETSTIADRRLDEARAFLRAQCIGPWKVV